MKPTKTQQRITSKKNLRALFGEEKGVVDTVSGTPGLKSKQVPAPSKPLPHTDLEAMMELCDKLTGSGREFRTGVWPVFEGGFDAVAVSPNGEHNSGKGKTRREAVENLLKKLKSVKK